jgi:hypothetical protein
MQNGHVESFNGKLRDECLNATCVRNLADAKKKSRTGETNTTANAHAVVWDIGRQMSLPNFAYIFRVRLRRRTQLV